MLSVTVGIPTYNAEENIVALLDSIHFQKGKSFKLHKIVVYDDGSSDKTRQLVRSYKSPLVQLVEAKQRRGFAAGVHYLLNQSTTDLTFLLNDDVMIIGDDFLEKTVIPFTQSKTVGLVCANPQPYPPKTFLERAIESGFRAYERAKMQIREGNSSLTCDGKTMHFSKAFIQSIKFPKNLSNMGNVDTYMYCLCIRNGFEYRYVHDAIVGFGNPTSVTDLTRWTRRNIESLKLIRSQFGTILDDDYNRAKHLFDKEKLIEFFRNPIGCLLLAGVTTYCSLAISFTPATFNPRWEVVRTTKKKTAVSIVQTATKQIRKDQ